LTGAFPILFLKHLCLTVYPLVLSYDLLFSFFDCLILLCEGRDLLVELVLSFGQFACQFHVLLLQFEDLFVAVAHPSLHALQPLTHALLEDLVGSAQLASFSLLTGQLSIQFGYLQL
jgi:hypothetical protein